MAGLFHLRFMRDRTWDLLRRIDPPGDPVDKISPGGIGIIDPDGKGLGLPSVDLADIQVRREILPVAGILTRQVPDR
jgi:hypothetical protein